MSDFRHLRRDARLSEDNTMLLELTTRIVVACIAQNHHASVSLSTLISETFAQLGSITSPAESRNIENKPAVPVKSSITPEYIICLEDGKHFKSLKGHLTALGMSPEQYREKWNLPSDYPMVAASLSAARSALARENKLGCGPAKRRSAGTKR